MNKLSSFLREFEKSKTLRLFMPGHQGKCVFLNKNFSPKLDITEIKNADWLFNSCGVIKDLEEKISRLYNSNCYISAGGSTLLIQTILWLLKDKKFIVFRGTHYSFFNAAAILSISFFLIGNHTTVSLLEIKKAFLKVGKGAVLFLTSPNYYGQVLNILKIRKICDEFNAILVVDCAHGGHFRFLKNNLHPIFLGADFCCCSFFKTLPALTGAAAIFIKPNLVEKQKVKKAMAIFASSSPSYLIMDSIGLCVDWLEKNGKAAFLKLQKRKEKLIKSLNLKFLKTEPSKLVLNCFSVVGGVKSVLLALKKFKIEPEFYNEKFFCFILTPFLKEKDWQRLENCLKWLVPAKCLKKEKEFNFKFKRGCSLKKALFKKKEKVRLKDAAFRICADIVFYEIPGVLLLSYGEILTKNFIKFLEQKGLKEIYVLKKEKNYKFREKKWKK